MNKLDQARADINRIDAEMARLFEQRMQAAKLVAEHKMEHGLPIRDEAREAALTNTMCSSCAGRLTSPATISGG